MSNLLVGVLCLLFSLFLFFLSPKENQNMFGYKSPQQGFHKNIWKWSNRCFGLLAMIGSAIYLITAVILAFLEIHKYDAMINRIGLVYIIICAIVTEIYTFILSRKKR